VAQRLEAGAVWQIPKQREESRIKSDQGIKRKKYKKSFWKKEIEKD